jgi:hypothetical protein
MPLDSACLAFTRSTKVVLSFGSRNGGFDFAVRLRESLMRTRGWTDPCSIYLDAISAAQHEESTSEPITVNGTVVQAYRNPRWRELYQAAMWNARAMVFIATPEWASSNWCADEYGWFDRIRAGQLDQQYTMVKRLPIVVVAYERALSMLGRSDKMLAHGAAVVSSRLAALPVSERAVRKGIQHAEGALIVLKHSLGADVVATEVHAALSRVGA